MRASQRSGPPYSLLGADFEVAWDCPTKTINTNANGGCEYSNGCLTLRHGLGQGSTWNGVPYPNWIANVRGMCTRLRTHRHT